MTTAVVFAYHNVGVRCLKVLLAHGVHVPLVVTHRDNPEEHVWFESVAQVANEYRLAVAYVSDPNTSDVIERVAELQPDFLFSFYFRSLLGPQLLAEARRGALNMHGSLLPKYRGRAPVNWAVLHGERETGATLHYMVEKPDAGDIVAQFAVPILPDDTAREVFDKVTLAAELTLDRVIPQLLTGEAARIPQNLALGSYFGGRKPADGIIDWKQPARRIHDLVRALTRPYPGAFTTILGAKAHIWRTQVLNDEGTGNIAIYLAGDEIHAQCGAGVLRVLELSMGDDVIEAKEFRHRFGELPVSLPS